MYLSNCVQFSTQTTEHVVNILKFMLWLNLMLYFFSKLLDKFD